MLNLGSGNATEYGVSEILLVDGTVLSRSQLISQALIGSPTNTQLYGTAGADTFDSRGYATYEQGNGGGDTFLYNQGYGNLELNEYAGNGISSTAVLQFGTGIMPSQVSVSSDRYGDILLTVGQSAGQVTIDGQLNTGSGGTTPYGAAQVQFSDGTIWTASQIKNMVS